MKRVPDILVERLALGELPADKAEAVRARLEAAGELHRLTELEASNARILDAYPSRNAAAQIAARAEAPPARRAWLLAPVLLAAAVALFVVIAPPSGDEAVTPSPDTVQFRGDAQLMVYQVTDGQAVLLEDGATLGEGDVVQLRYRAMPSEVGQQGAILSVDGRGAVTTHFAGPLAAEAPTLSRSYRLDDAPDFERFYYFAGEALDTEALERALRVGEVPEARFAFTVRKEASR